MKLKPLKVMLNVAAKTFKKYKYYRLGASQSQKLPPTDGPPTFSSNLIPPYIENRLLAH